MYPFASYPNRPELLQAISTAAARVERQLRRIEPLYMDISEYNRRYLQDYQRKLHTRLQRHCYLLAWALADCDKPLDRITLVDYGAGAGVTTILAKACGIGTVIYNDIYDVSCQDAHAVALKLGKRADHYVCGNSDALDSFVRGKGLICDVVIGADVIEHIYDTDRFFGHLEQLSGGDLTVAFSTHANPHNRVASKALVAKQLAAEYDDREETPGHKQRDNLSSYVGIRKNVIRTYAGNELDEDTIDKMAVLTRGMIAKDIRLAVDDYLRTKTWPAAPTHPTNTCDPLTGNWVDKLVTARELRDGLNAAGFHSRVLCCHYGSPRGMGRKLAAGALDIAIRVTGRPGLRLAPAFLLVGTRVAAPVVTPQPVVTTEPVPTPT